MKALINYKDWLLKTRGKIKPKVGDILVKPQVKTSERHDQREGGGVIVQEEGQYLSKRHIEKEWHLNLLFREIKAGKNRGVDILKDYYIEIKIPEIEWIYDGNDNIIC